MRPADGGGGGSSIGVSLGKIAAKAVTPHPTARRRTSNSGSSGRSSGGYSRRSSGGSSGGTSGGGNSSGGGGGGGGRVTAPAAPSLAQYLSGDSTYQSTASGAKRSLADYMSELARRRGEAGTQFNQTTASMERDRVQQLSDLKDEFASRGLIQSGLYGQEQGTFQQKFTDQQTALQQQQAALLADLLSQQKNYQRQNDLTLEQAKQEALARRAAKYNIGG